MLVSNDGKQECIFDGWYNKDYTQARVKYWLDTSNENNIKCLEQNQPLTSVMFKQEDKEKIECYITTIEEWYGGKLNLETLEIEKKAMRAKGQPAFKTFDKVLVRDSDAEEWKPAIFIRMSKEEEKEELPYQVFNLYYCFSHETAQCIPYEGNEHLAFTSDLADLSF